MDFPIDWIANFQDFSSYFTKIVSTVKPRLINRLKDIICFFKLKFYVISSD